MYILITIVIVCLLVIVIQDIKHRQLHVLMPICIFTASAAIKYLYFIDASLFSIVLNNSVFLITALTVVTIYMSIRERKFLNPFKTFFGMGDFLFYIAISPLFLLRNYILYFVLSLLFAIVMQYIFVKNPTQQTVPLAGFASLFLIFTICSNLLFNLPVGITI